MEYTGIIFLIKMGGLELNYKPMKWKLSKVCYPHNNIS